MKNNAIHETGSAQHILHCRSRRPSHSHSLRVQLSCKVWTCDFWDNMQADRQTNRKITRHTDIYTDTLIAILCTPTGKWSIYLAVMSTDGQEISYYYVPALMRRCRWIYWTIDLTVAALPRVSWRRYNRSITTTEQRACFIISRLVR